MAGIDDLITTFMGQAQQGLNAPPAPWQQELLETVNPEKVRRQNIARALAKASTAMATTPGNFLAGVSAAASTGADAYLTGRDEAEAERMKVQQLVQMQQQKDQDRRLSLLMDAIGVQRNQISDKRAQESHEMGLEKDRAYTDYYKRRGTGAATDLNPNQIRIAKNNILTGVDRLRKRLENPQGNQPWLSEDEIEERLLAEQERLEEIYGVRLTDPDESANSPQVVAPGKVDQVVPKNSGTTPQVPSAEAAQSGILNAPPPANQRVKNQVYQTPKGPMIWTGNGWTPAQ